MLQKFLSRILGKLADNNTPQIKNFLIKQFIKLYNVDLKEAVIENVAQYPNFNAFFTRHLKQEARPIFPNVNDFLSPVDGTLYQWGEIKNNTLINAKRKPFTLEALLARQEIKNAPFRSFFCFYLSPRDYHRVHLPVAGKLTSMTYVPGSFFSVNPFLTDYAPQIFAKNERIIAYFNTPFGEIAVILVGALGVGSIQMKWQPELATKLTHFAYDETQFCFAQGEEIGHFQLGSTVIVLFPKNFATSLKLGTHVKMGQKINV